MACCSPFGISHSQDMPHQSDIDRVAAKIATVKKDIKKVERQLEEARKRDVANLSEEEKKRLWEKGKTYLQEKGKTYLQEKEEQLRKEEEQLWEKKKQLRAEENLLKKQLSGQTAFVSLSLLTPLTIFLLKQSK